MFLAKTSYRAEVHFQAGRELVRVLFQSSVMPVERDTFFHRPRLVRSKTDRVDAEAVNLRRHDYLCWPWVTGEDMVAEGVGSVGLVRILEKALHLVHHNTRDIWRPAYHVHPPSEHHKSLLDPRP
ncbi:hypothetical protein Pmani_032256 [Petrolisthes manimaculis]|uniref:Uncharacterized protein n=1 Tax=Petrolisthes manimaculis TaxID=1843537 RepID=A0AAE1NU49_9EUCA|nr:hypothetical protein Pmani_032256 [Petrolisthes manimaculis]